MKRLLPVPMAVGRGSETHVGPVTVGDQLTAATLFPVTSHDESRQKRHWSKERPDF